MPAFVRAQRGGGAPPKFGKDVLKCAEQILLTGQGAGAWPNTFRTSKYDVFLSPTGSASLGITNLTGHPAACLKAGFVDGLPQALMITGRLYDEASVLRVALAYERATKWSAMHPPLEDNLKKMKTAAARVGNRAIGDRMIGDRIDDWAISDW